MGGVDIITFTGGVGENGPETREMICSNMEFLGIKLDPEKNEVRGREEIISEENMKVKVLVVPTDEELVIANDTKKLVAEL